MTGFILINQVSTNDDKLSRKKMMMNSSKIHPKNTESNFTTTRIGS